MRAVAAFLVLAAIVAGPVGAQNLPVPPLPYAYNALEPHIDEATMRVHHDGHHAAYAKKISAVLAALRSNPEKKHLAKMGVDSLIERLHMVPVSTLGNVKISWGAETPACCLLCCVVCRGKRQRPQYPYPPVSSASHWP